jgi:hypothetical protein
LGTGNQYREKLLDIMKEYKRHTGQEKKDREMRDLKHEKRKEDDKYG